MLTTKKGVIQEEVQDAIQEMTRGEAHPHFMFTFRVHICARKAQIYAREDYVRTKCPWHADLKVQSTKSTKCVYAIVLERLRLSWAP